MYHIDRNDKLRLNIKDKLLIKKGALNVTFTSILNRLGRLQDISENKDTLDSLIITNSFPIKEEYDKWDLEKYPSSERIYIHK